MSGIIELFKGEQFKVIMVFYQHAEFKPQSPDTYPSARRTKEHGQNESIEDMESLNMDVFQRKLLKVYLSRLDTIYEENSSEDESDDFDEIVAFRNKYKLRITSINGRSQTMSFCQSNKREATKGNKLLDKSSKVIRGKKYQQSKTRIEDSKSEENENRGCGKRKDIRTCVDYADRNKCRGKNKVYWEQKIDEISSSIDNRKPISIKRFKGKKHFGASTQCRKYHKRNGNIVDNLCDKYCVYKEFCKAIGFEHWGTYKMFAEYWDSCTKLTESVFIDYDAFYECNEDIEFGDCLQYYKQIKNQYARLTCIKSQETSNGFRKKSEFDNYVEDGEFYKKTSRIVVNDDEYCKYKVFCKEFKAYQMFVICRMRDKVLYITNDNECTEKSKNTYHKPLIYGEFCKRLGLTYFETFTQLAECWEYFLGVSAGDEYDFKEESDSSSDSTDFPSDEGQSGECEKFDESATNSEISDCSLYSEATLHELQVPLLPLAIKESTPEGTSESLKLKLSICNPRAIFAAYRQVQFGRRFEIDLSTEPSLMDFVRLYTFLSARGQYRPDNVLNVLRVKHQRILRTKGEEFLRSRRLDRKFTTFMIYLGLMAAVIIYILYWESQPHQHLQKVHRSFHFLNY